MRKAISIVFLMTLMSVLPSDGSSQVVPSPGHRIGSSRWMDQFSPARSLRGQKKRFGYLSIRAEWRAPSQSPGPRSQHLKVSKAPAVSATLLALSGS